MPFHLRYYIIIHINVFKTDDILHTTDFFIMVSKISASSLNAGRSFILCFQHRDINWNLFQEITRIDSSLPNDNLSLKNFRAIISTWMYCQLVWFICPNRYGRLCLYYKNINLLKGQYFAWNTDVFYERMESFN